MSNLVHLRPADRNAFEVAIICALTLESDAVEVLFDQFWEDEGHCYDKSVGDFNSYTLGRIGRHNVVLAYLPGMGKSHSASASASFRSSFPNVRLGMVVGVCGGVPQPVAASKEIYLGDVIFSTGIVQFDLGRQFDDKTVRKDTLLDNLDRPNTELRGFLNQLQGWRGKSSLREQISQCIEKVLANKDFEEWEFPGRDCDYLYQADYRHKHQDLDGCPICVKCDKTEDAVCDEARRTSCAQLRCEEAKLVPREYRDQNPALHFGLLASGDGVMKSAVHRDRIASKEQVLGFEMEGAGVWDNFPTVVIKGVCDYADGHKYKQWQRYAALTAAASAKAFLNAWRGVDRNLGTQSSMQGSTLAQQPPHIAEPGYHQHFNTRMTQGHRVQNTTSPQLQIEDIARNRPVNNFSGTFTSGRNMYNGGTFDSNGGPMQF